EQLLKDERMAKELQAEEYAAQRRQPPYFGGHRPLPDEMMYHRHRPTYDWMMPPHRHTETEEDSPIPEAEGMPPEHRSPEWNQYRHRSEAMPDALMSHLRSACDGMPQGHRSPEWKQPRHRSGVMPDAM